MAEGKRENLRLAASCLDGVLLEPGAILSFWFLVGAPTAMRGYRPGMELRSGCVVPSPGGGLCQLAGALFTAGLEAGLTVVEHHPHSLELAPEADRIRPFGTGAAVAYPYRDLQLRNDLAVPLALCARLDSESLVVEWRGPELPEVQVRLEERRYGTAREDGRLVRSGELWAVYHRAGAVVTERRIGAGRVFVMEEMADHHCHTCERTCDHAPDPATSEVQAARAEVARHAHHRLRVLP